MIIVYQVGVYLIDAIAPQLIAHLTPPQAQLFALCNDAIFDGVRQHVEQLIPTAHAPLDVGEDADGVYFLADAPLVENG